jgi:hypothetical protein
MSTVRRVHHKRDGLLLVEDDGSARFLTWWESLRFRLTGAMPALQRAAQVRANDSGVG